MSSKKISGEREIRLIDAQQSVNYRMHTLQNRFISIDLLRALAILGMILSGYIAYGGVMPSWMYHAQIPPPTHSFNPQLPGLTWVDLVFPMFLFTMGIAFPFSLRKKLEKGTATASVIKKLFIRFLLLAYFAIYFQHVKPYTLSASPTFFDWALSLIGFLFLVGAYGGYQKYFNTKTTGQYSFLIGSFLYLIALHVGIESFEFSLNRSDIIILVLSNVAFVGALFWMITKDNAMHRILCILGVMALKIGASVADSWANQLWTFDAIDWLFRVSFLEYLIIVLAGSLVGDWLLISLKSKPDQYAKPKKPRVVANIILLFLIVSVSLAGLFVRWGFQTVIMQFALILALYLNNRVKNTQKEIAIFSAALLMIGMLMEPFEGGVKKDPTTISYLFITAGLSGFMMLFCMDVLKIIPEKKLSWLIESGQNPMIAYVLPAIFLVPIFGILGVHDWINYLNANEWTGFLKGLIYTLLSMIITSQLTRRGFILKT